MEVPTLEALLLGGNTVPDGGAIQQHMHTPSARAIEQKQEWITDM